MDKDKWKKELKKEVLADLFKKSNVEYSSDKQKNGKVKAVNKQLKHFNFSWKEGVLCVAKKTYFGYSTKINYKHILEALGWFCLVKEKTHLSKFTHLDDLTVWYDSSKRRLSVDYKGNNIYATSQAWVENSLCYYIAKTFLEIKGDR